MGSFNETIQKVRTGSISDDAFESILREEIIAPWEAALSEFESETAENSKNFQNAIASYMAN